MTKGIVKSRIEFSAEDLLPLGLHPQLHTLDRKTVRSQLSFMSRHGGADRLRAVKILISRVIQYYGVIGYVGPQVGRGGSDIGYGLGGWVNDGGRVREARRQAYQETDIYLWSTPDSVFNDLRYCCIKTALRIAEWEISNEVPESAEALKYACWAAYGAITGNQIAQINWRGSRNKLGTTGVVRHLTAVLRELDLFRYHSNELNPFLGHYQKIITCEGAN